MVFIPRTNHTGSLEWLTSIVDGISSYSVLESNGPFVKTLDGNVGKMFVWIDGDIVFLENHTIATMVQTKLSHPNSLVVSANVANDGALKHLHNRHPVALPYHPELQPVRPVDHDSWRASTLPRWRGPADFRTTKGFSPPFENHRWLPSDDETFNHTPIGMSMYSDNGPDLGDWTVKAQQHYSFLHHLDLGDLYRYKFPIWTNPTDSISTNFFCFMNNDANPVFSFMYNGGLRGTDLKTPRNEGRVAQDIIIDGKGLAAHYESDLGSEDLDDTDVLWRYRSYALEMVCPQTTKHCTINITANK